MHHKIIFSVPSSTITELLVKADTETEAIRLATEATSEGREDPSEAVLAAHYPTVHVLDRRISLDDSVIAPPDIEEPDPDEIAEAKTVFARRAQDPALALRTYSPRDGSSNLIRGLRINHVLDEYVAGELDAPFCINNAQADLTAMLTDVIHYCDQRQVSFAVIVAGALARHDVEVETEAQRANEDVSA